MSHVIGKVMGPGVTLISSAAETALEAKNILARENMLRQAAPEKVKHRFFVSGNPAPFNAIGEPLLQSSLATYQVLLT